MLVNPFAGASVVYYIDGRANTAQRFTAAGDWISDHMYDAFGATVPVNDADLPVDASDPFDAFGAQFGYRTDLLTDLLPRTNRIYCRRTVARRCM